MAQLPIISFDCARDPEGYRLIDSVPRRLVRNGQIGNEVSCPPLSGEEFRIFARIESNARAAEKDARALAFVRQYGPLTPEGLDPDRGDQVELVMLHARMMRDLLAVADSGHFFGPDGAPAYFGCESTVHSMVVFNPATKSLGWLFRPNTLLDALWLQFGQAVTRGAHLRACEHCGDWFEAGAGTGRRADARFCSDEHRVRHNSLKRSKG